MAAMLGLVLLIGCALAVVAAAVLDHRRAQSAADLAALAGASAAGRGADACAQAARIVADARAELTSCRVEGRDVLVKVRVGGPHWLGQQGDLVAEARAGPAG